jgi:Uri superfamily endonuclease
VVEVLKGIYVLIIQVSGDVAVQVGALGKLTFKKGLYAYVGSAQGNLEQRVRRHLRKEKRKFWHVDYLLESDAAEVIAIFHKQADKTEECTVAKAIGEKGEAVVGFGASDCNCKSHLFRLENLKFLQESIQVFSVGAFLKNSLLSMWEISRSISFLWIAETVRS